MDLLNSTLVLYLMVGAGIGLAVYLSSPGGRRAEVCFRVLTAVAFWPLYVPLLLRGVPVRIDSEALDELARSIAQVEAELRAALASVQGGENGALAQETARLEEFRSVWLAFAARIREMDRLLQAADNAVGLTRDGTSERWQKSDEARQRNLKGIRRLRERTYDELMASLAWVRELVSMLHLARFTGAPAARARELLNQIAGAVQSLAEGRLERADESRYRAGEPKTPTARVDSSLSPSRARSAAE
jgi:hypothetical protein